MPITRFRTKQSPPSQLHTEIPFDEIRWDALKLINEFLSPWSGHTGLFLVPFTTSVELVGTKMVTFWSNMSHVPFALGQFVVIMIAYGERDWRTFQASQNPRRRQKLPNLISHFRSTPRCRFSASYSFTSSRPSPLVGSSRTSGMERRGTSSRRLPRSIKMINL